ncbi:Por secretion system C-terminal sorting domain-containing protein [Hymenobacter arizonensis]|uniref:Por secretion system C-terminal sorting domain-containing protein n=2 Tax=Hymenobacter arizonensis TaxID=1227077 RepID=A0A1I6A912_HYMAR|nr:Por secretion system C-terminal sorting domain-containing protein [Hymenobacter arizonensis]
MTNFYKRSKWAQGLRKLGFAALLTMGTAIAGQAQVLNYRITGALNTVTTYTDLGTTGTAVATANTDDANSTAQPIGFTFSYNGATFTQFVLNTNGFIKLGAIAPSSAAMFLDEDASSSVENPFETANDPNLIVPFNIDLTAGSTGGTEYRVATTGTTGSRVCTIQWKNVQDKASVAPTQYANMSFQVRLYEGTNVIELVYNAASAGGTSALRFAQVGLKGTDFDDGQIVQVVKQSTAAWSAATFANFTEVVTTGFLNTFNIRSVAAPDAGRTFRFTPITPIPNDIAVLAVYTLGKIATPSALPQAVRVFISNEGTNAQNGVAVTLSITGANTITNTVNVNVPVGVGGIVTFPALPATLALGTNTVTVSVANDDNNANNSATVTQLVTADRLSYIDQGQPINNAGPTSYGATGGVLSVKYTVTNPVVLADASITFAAVNGNPTTSFQVVVHDATGTGNTPGNLIFSSPAQNRPAAGGNVTVALPSLQLSGSFYIGVKELEPTGAAIASQTEAPLRSGTFYVSANGSAPWIDLAATTFTRRFAIEAGLAPAPNCAPATALAVTSSTPNGATVTFTDASNSGSYQLIYGPVGFQPNTSGTTITATASPFTLTGLQPGTTYQVYVRTNCSAGGTSLLTGPVSFSTSCNAVTTISSFPYTENFDALPTGVSLPCGYTILNANNDGATWAITNTNPSSGANSIRYRSLLANSVAADDWFFTPALTLGATSRYQVAFRYRGEGIANSPSNFTESLEVTSGTAPTVAAQTNVLYTNTAITNTTYALANASSTPMVALLPAGASTQYVGFHVKSAANQGALYIDDISITTTAVTANSEALLRAISVFPNPSTTGFFDLEIHGANAKGRLGVLVTNTLGQQVYSGSARDNYSNKLDLSNLAPGIYYLQVRNGNEQMTSRVSIVK